MSIKPVLYNKDGSTGNTPYSFSQKNEKTARKNRDSKEKEGHHLTQRLDGTIHVRLDGSERNAQFGSGVRIGIVIQAYQLDHPAGLFRQALNRLVETVQPVGPFDIVAAEVEIDLVGDEFAAVQLLPAAQRMRAA